MSERDRSSASADHGMASAIGTRRAEIVSEVDAPAIVAAAIAPDDTDEIDTRVEDGRVVTTIERETTGGLEATIDDYVVALDVAVTVANASEDADGDADTGAHPGTAEQSSDRPNTDTL
jgi:hypothetical protein